MLICLGISSCLGLGDGQQHSNSADRNEATVLHNPDDEYSEQSGKASGLISDTQKQTSVKPNGKYTSKKQVALYIHTYNKLPQNYITKKEAEKLGWISSKGNLNEVAPGKSIGGDRFGNYEGKLPKANKRRYFECDIDYKGGRRNSKRIIYSNDGLIYYTGDHYNNFEQLY